jgi:methylenetetrahydrofolate dehydrogenase (NADP+)/methenyltetrahydrofolate cyclohydrolase
MTAQKMDGAQVAQSIRDRVAERVAQLTARGIRPGLAAVIVGDDPGSKFYVGSKVRTCEALGLYSEKHELPEATSTEQLLALIADLNSREEIDGILVQMPLPPQIDARRILDAVDSARDVDGFHPTNVGRLVRGEENLVACTPAGVIHMLDHYQIPIKGANAVVLGRSDIVGKPMAMLLLHRHATVTICHSRTQHLMEITRQADILIAAIGKTAMVTGDFVREGAVVVDVGINKVTEAAQVEKIFADDELPKRRDEMTRKGYTIVGDVQPRSVVEKAAWLTPVPGGVGPLTIATLMMNTTRAAELRRG